MTVSANQLEALETEQQNPSSHELDRLSTSDLVNVLHAENHSVAKAVDATLPEVVKVIDEVAHRLASGGRLFYVGAGTSGRLGVLDASECPPTFGVERELVQGVIAGGQDALVRSIEGVEDKIEAASRDLGGRRLNAKDVVIGIAASGRTPYVVGALQTARKLGAFTVAVVNVSDAVLSQEADVTIKAVTGPEAITGSTRLKAGTAQKLILNLISTGVMVKLGKVYGNLMVDVTATNVKLQDRAARIVMHVTKVDRAKAEAALQQANGHAKTAIVMLALGLSAEQASHVLSQVGGRLREALSSNAGS